jgi:hypothetical protein
VWFFINDATAHVLLSVLHQVAPNYVKMITVYGQLGDFGSCQVSSFDSQTFALDQASG